MKSIGLHRRCVGLLEQGTEVRLRVLGVRGPAREFQRCQEPSLQVVAQLVKSQEISWVWWRMPVIPDLRSRRIISSGV